MSLMSINCHHCYRLWPVGRVVETFPGKDDLVRTARVETKTSLLTRPFDKLCLLEDAGQYEN